MLTLARSVKNTLEMKYKVSASEYFNLSKIYERCLLNEMTTHFDNILSEYQCGFQKRIFLKYGEKKR